MRSAAIVFGAEANGHHHHVPADFPVGRPHASSNGLGLTEDRRRCAPPRSFSRNVRRQLFSAAFGFASRSKKAVVARLPRCSSPTGAGPKIQREARIELALRQKEEWQTETRERAARLPKGVRGLWHRITGQYQQVRSQNEAEAKNTTERHDQQRQALVDFHLSERSGLQSQVKELRGKQAEELTELRGEIGRFLKFSRGHDPGPRQTQGRSASLGLSLER